MKTGFAREIITPKRGAPLCGYFNPRPNTGKYDDLTLKALVIEESSVKSAIVLYDICFIGLKLAERLKKALVDAGIDFADRVMFSATHTHTGPYSKPFFGAPEDTDFIEGLISKTVSAVKAAEASLYETELCMTVTKCATQAFNRRYFMKNGRVLTNPGKLNCDVVEPEGPVDYEIPVLVFKQDGNPVLILANIVNHTDTIGGDIISADWPGRMERYIQDGLGFDIPVMTLIGCSGNINHFDITWDDPQTSYDEAKRIGKAYSEVILRALHMAKKVDSAPFKVESSVITVPFSTISDGDLAKAKSILEKVGSETSDKNLTSEGLATGDGPVARFFAEQLIAYRERCSGKERDFTIMSFKFGKSLAIVSLPGEPFTEIGMAIKANSEFPVTVVAALSMGAVGYVPMKECFATGGYEILPVEDGNPVPETAQQLIDAATELVNR